MAKLALPSRCRTPAAPLFNNGFALLHRKHYARDMFYTASIGNRLSLYTGEMNLSEKGACTPQPLKVENFNKAAAIPFGCTVDHIRAGMQDFLSFLGFINVQLATKKISRLESFMMQANFSSLVGEFMGAAIPKYCPTLMRNKYHNGHPDLLPTGQFPKDSMLHADQGIEIKGSRHVSGWQGHNAENVWLMVFVFDSNTPRDEGNNIPPRPFRFVKVVGALITKRDWKFSGRSAKSRRTITASVTRSGFRKMEGNWIYRESLK